MRRTGVLFMTLVLLIVGALAITYINRPTPSATFTTPTVTPSRNLNWAIIINVHDLETTARWQEYKKTLIGTRIEGWQGKVIDAKEENGFYVVGISMYNSGALDIALATDKPTMLRAQRGDQVRFDGKIVGVDDTKGLLVTMADGVATFSP